MKLIILGTANGNFNEHCYNTCFCIENNNEYFLIDGGGGNQILGRLLSTGIKLTDIHDIFISHSHPDHIIGIVWVLKKICGAIRKGKYHGDCNIYANKRTILAIKTIRDLVFDEKNILPNIKFIAVDDNETKSICGLSVRFFDTKAEKQTQFGFSLNNNEIVFCGDEPLVEDNFLKMNHCKWLLHNAFCLDEDGEKYKVHSMSHSTVGEAAKIAHRVNAKNLVLLHTETDNLDLREEMYIKNAKRYFTGNVFVPDDLSIIDIN